MPTIEQARSWYSASDPVHGFDHILRVYRLVERLAVAEGADLEIARSAALLHDAYGDHKDQETGREDHHKVSAEFAAQILRAEGRSETAIAAVQHCIRAHRFRDEMEKPETLEAQVLFDADKLDAIGAVGVARSIAYAVRSGMPVYAPPSECFLKTGRKEIGEPHSAYHEYLYKLRVLKGRLYTLSARSIAAGRHSLLVNFFEGLAAEEQGER